MRWGAAGAGLLLVASDTRRVLLLLRSAGVTEPGTWGVPGGRLEPGEAPLDGAMREAAEEIDFRGPVAIVGSYVYRESGFEFTTFVGMVESEFRPRLNWESDDARWFMPDEWPDNLHFGVRHVLQTMLIRLSPTPSRQR